MSAAPRTLVLAGGTPPYTDPWHPFADTSAQLARIATDLGFEVEVATNALGRLANLDGVDLLVANVPSPTEPLDSDLLGAAARGLDGFLARPGGVIALHVSVTTLLGIPAWSELMGAAWVAGTTMHPPLGRSLVHPVPGAPFVGTLSDFTLHDERYSFLEFAGVSTPIVTHEFEQVTHPVVWTREVGHTRVVADALGHGRESFDSAEHVALLREAFLWAADLSSSAPLT